MAELRAGLIGLGMMGRHHARVLGELPGVRFVAAADDAGDVHRATGDASVVAGVDELIALGIDMAVVAVPTAFHEEIGIKLAEAGIHALIEKPIAADSAAGNRLIDAFESRGLVGAVGHIERFNPALQSLRARIANGDLGDVYQIATRRQGPFPARIADVGVIKDLGTHDFDSTAWLAQSNYATIYAQTILKSGRPHEDLVTATGRLENQTATSHLVNWLSPLKERFTIVTGEKGSFVADTISADLTYYENGTQATDWESVAAFRGVSEGSMTRFALTKREPLRVEHEAFRDAILGARNDIVTLREGLATLRVAECAIESSKTGQAITL